MSEGAHDDDGTLQQVLDALFALDGLSLPQQADVASETLQALFQCSGAGIGKTHNSTRGGYDLIRSDTCYDHQQTHYGRLINGLFRTSAQSSRMQQAARPKLAADG